MGEKKKKKLKNNGRIEWNKKTKPKKKKHKIRNGKIRRGRIDFS
jgi:hypothetical protein